MKHTAYKFSIITLALVFLLTLTAFFGVNFISAKAEGTVTVSGTNVFTATEDANVIADKQGDKYYTMFSLASDDDAVSYRRNLAYNWYSQVTEGEGDDATTSVVNGMFNMEIGFKNTAFEKFVITFESQQYSKTKDGKTVNYIVFFPEGSGVKVLITDKKDAGKEDLQSETVLGADHIVMKFTEKVAGAYNLTVGNEGGASVPGEFKNVGGNYSKSSTSSSSPVYPLIFNARFDKDAEKKAASMVLYSLNGQVFEVENASHDEGNDYYYGGTVKDKLAPVLCLNKEFAYFTQGGKVDIDYTVIDVLRSSPSSTVYYYVLGYEQFTDGEVTDFNDKELFAKVEDDDVLETDMDKYLPVNDDLKGTKFNTYDKEGTLTADMLVKVYVEITDTTASTGEKDYVYLDWYVSKDYKVSLKGADFLAVADDKLGATYNYEGKDGKSWDDILKDYQKKVDELAKDLSAGSSSYLYLPSAENLFTDDATAYTDMKLSVYYYHDSQSSNTNLSTNNLSINVTKQGAYTFTIYANDAANNKMYYLDKEGKVVEFASSEVWEMYNDKDENGLYEKLPWFTFDVGYTGVQFEETPGMQSTAYVGTSYNSASFKINGVTGSYDTNYRLFLFDRAGYYNDKGVTFSYEEFIEQMDELYENARTYFTEILQVSETDAEYDDFKDYGWSNSSTSFTPQDSNAFYMIRAEVTDKQYVTDPVSCSLAVVASIKAKTIKGESDWLKNNVASVVLLSVAGVALIAIILLFVIKPKDKGDIDAQFENEKKKEKKKNK